MKKKIDIKFQGKGTRPSLTIRDSSGKNSEVDLVSGSASFEAEVDEKHYLFWLVIGSADDDYEISLAISDDSFEVNANRNPIKKSVPNGNAGYGRERFVVCKKQREQA